MVYHIETCLLNWLWQKEICKSVLFEGSFGILRLDVFRHYNQAKLQPVFAVISQVFDAPLRSALLTYF